MQLLIFTSPNHPEFNNYWHLKKENFIIKNGQEFNDSLDWNIDNIKQLINNDEQYLILIHESNNDAIYKISQQISNAIVAGYSTLDNTLNNTLWSWNNSENIFILPNEEPELPFDKLCWALNISDEHQRKQKINEAKDAIIKFFKNRTNDQDELEDKLRLLHACLTSEGAKNILQTSLADKLGIEEEVYKLSQIQDPFSKEYIEILTETRDKLLEG
jgi:hypothetical protein